MIRAFLFAVVVSLALVTVVSADDVVANPGGNVLRNNDNGIVWISPNTGYLIYQTTTNVGTAGLNWTKTTNGGVSWSSPVTIQAVGSLEQPSPIFAIWYDKWTMNDNGSVIHITFLCRGTSGCPNGTPWGTYYTSLDTSNDVLSSTITVNTTNCCVRSSLSITKSVAGSLYLFSATGTSVADNYRFQKSVNNGTTWSVLANAGSGVYGKLVPVEPVGVGIGIDDVFMLTTTGDIRQYNQVANSWGTAAFLWSSTGNPTPNIAQNQIGPGAIESSSLSVVTNPTVGATDKWSTFYGVLTGTNNNVRDGFYVLRNSPSTGFTNVTPVYTSLTTGTLALGGLMYDDPNSRLYAVWVNYTLNQIFYKFSDDFGDTWSDEIRYDLTANSKGDVSISNVVNLSGGRFMPVWEESPALVTELDSAIILIGDSDVGTDQDFENRLDRFVSGMGFRGTSGAFWFASLTSMFLAGMMMLFRVPLMVTAAVVGMWSTLMALVGFLPFGVYLSAVTVFGIILIFLILKTMQGSEGDL